MICVCLRERGRERKGEGEREIERGEEGEGGRKGMMEGGEGETERERERETHVTDIISYNTQRVSHELWLTHNSQQHSPILESLLKHLLSKGKHFQNLSSIVLLYRQCLTNTFSMEYSRSTYVC